MAGDWIKFETATSDKPEIWEIATSLEIDPDAVVGKLLRVWAWFDEHTEKGNAPSVTKALLDRRVGVTGFVTAMIGAGWMHEADGMIGLPNFDRHNGKTAKTRALTAKRVSEHKKGNAGGNAKGNAASVTKALPREEKRREEEYTHTQASSHQTGGGRAEGFEEDWERWLRYRENVDGRRMDEIQQDEVLMDLHRRGPEKARRDIKFSLLHGSKSILDSDNDFQKRQHSGGSQPIRKRVPSKQELGF